MSIVIVIEIYPGSLRPAGFNPVSPYCELAFRVVVTIPAFRAVQADIDFVGRSYELVGQARCTARAEDDSGLSEGAVNLFIPPACVPKFHDVAARGVKLGDNIVEAGPGVAIARRQLKQETSHAFAQDIGDHSEIPDERLCAIEFLDVSDVVADLDR